MPVAKSAADAVWALAAGAPWTTAVVGAVVVIAVMFPRVLSVKGAALVCLTVYQRIQLLLLRLRGLTPASAAERRIVTGRAWEEFCDTIKAAGAAMLVAGAPRDAATQAEGYRYLSRLVRAGLENFVECADVRAPRITSIVNGRRACPVKMGSDNPDNLYQVRVR